MMNYKYYRRIFFECQGRIKRDGYFRQKDQGSRLKGQSRKKSGEEVE
jgi:hypothetical protein